MNLKRDAKGMCISNATGGVPSETSQQVGRAIEVAVPADSGLGVLPRRPLPDADSEGPASPVVLAPRVSAAPPKEPAANVPDQPNKFTQPEALARELLRSAQLDASSCLRLIGSLPKDQSMRTSQETSSGGFKVSFGFYARAGQSRAFNNCDNMPMVCRYLAPLVTSRLLAACNKQVQDKHYSYIAWRFRLSEEKLEEIQASRPRKIARLDDCIFDEVPSRDISDSGVSQMFLAHLLDLLAFAFCMLEVGHLSSFRAYNKLFIKLAFQKPPADSGLRCPNVTEMQSADKEAWKSIL